MPVRILVLCAWTLTLAACSSSTSSTSEIAEPRASELDDYTPGPMAMRRLTADQFVSSIHALFGDDLAVFPPTEVDTRVSGLLSLGANAASITPAGFERYEASARQVATDVFSPERRARVLSCGPDAPASVDDACAEELVNALAPLVLRRALRPGEASAYAALARSTTQELGDFYKGLEAILSSWLLSPDFLFIQERAHPVDPEASSAGLMLTGDTLASRLSYFLWNTGPDAELLDAAWSGELDTAEGYRTQLDRLLADSGRLEMGVRALFSDLYDLDALDHAQKDPERFPEFTLDVVADAKEQTLRTIVEHLLVERADYRDLFTTRKTFMTRSLGPIYGVAVAEDWEPYEFAAGGPRAGILSHVSFLALQARTSRSSPVLRGKFVLDSLLCTPIPPPPATVNSEAIAPENGLGPTARDRLAVHRADPNCAVCHDAIDPIGLPFENFDAIGRFRTQEDGIDIETYGEISGVAYDDITGLYPTLHDTPRLTTCMVRQLFMHAVGRLPGSEEDEVLGALETDFATDSYDFVELMRNVALTHGFRATSGPREADETEGEGA
ncbi:MAG: DUF1588 domain-containing protein [Myxococcales bacterium]|nr:MAG: DUF1588 domain-containing protein [Myxococcales bacterium]